MGEIVHERDFLHQVFSDGAHQLVEVILGEALSAVRQPEGDVVMEGWVLTEGLDKQTVITVTFIKQGPVFTVNNGGYSMVTSLYMSNEAEGGT